MYKELVLFSKTKDHTLSIDIDEQYLFAKDIKLLTLGLSEIHKTSAFLPVVISGGDENKFITICALSNQDNIFCNNKTQYIHIPHILKTYPFTMVNSYEENNKNRFFRTIAYDASSSLIGHNKKYPLFTNTNELSQYGAKLLQLVQKHEKDLQEASELVQTLQEYNLLDKREYAITTSNNEKKSLLSEFYVVNKQRLYELDDTILSTWAKKGWVSVIENHIASIVNINTLLQEYSN